MIDNLHVKTAVSAAVVNSKGGVGKTTTTANVGGLLADPEAYGLRVLLIDCDQSQPALSSYYPIAHRAKGGIFELFTQGDVPSEDIISRTKIPGLDVILSNDPQNKLSNVLLHAPDGRFRLKAALPRLSKDYDVVLVDTKGEKGIIGETALLAVDMAFCPLPAETLPAREFKRGMLDLIDTLRPLAANTGGFLRVPPMAAFINCYDDRTVDAQHIVESLRTEVFSTIDTSLIRLLNTEVPRRLAYREASTFKIPVHRHPTKAAAATAASTMHALVAELFPMFSLVKGEPA